MIDFKFIFILNIEYKLKYHNWGLGIGDWGLGIGQSVREDG